MIRKIGYVFLVAGFATIVFMCAVVSAKTYTSWIWHTKNLSQQQISTDAASDAIRDVTLKLNGLVRQTIWPAIAMLVGGLMIGFQQKKKESQPTNPPYSSPAAGSKR